MKKVELSVIITAHTEGPLAQKTLKSVFQALKEVEKQNITYEIIINIDRGDEATTNHLLKYRNDPRFTILETDFGDLGLSRNYARSKAHGTFISYLDADDLISKNWYTRAIAQIKTSDHPVVIHPKASLLFGPETKTTLCLFRDSGSKAAEALIALGANRWISTAVARREIFDDTPYIATKNGYGHEDYTFNLQTLAKNIAHETAKNTVHFYRRRAGSLVSTSNQSHVTQPYTDLFDIHYLNNLPPITPQRHFCSNHCIPPRYVQEAMREITPIEPEIKLTKTIKEKGLPVFDPDTNNSFVCPAFLKLISPILRLPEKIAVVGSIDDLSETTATFPIAIITDTPIPDKFTPKADITLLDFAKHSHWLNPGEKDILLTRLLIQLRPKTLKFLNSKYGKTWQSNHKELRLIS